MRRELVGSLRSLFRRRRSSSRDAAEALTVVRHVDPQIPALDLTIAISLRDDDEPPPLMMRGSDERPPLMRSNASRDLLNASPRASGSADRPRVRARRNAIIHHPFDGSPFDAFGPDARNTSASSISEELSEELSALLPARTLCARSAAALSEVCAICCEDMKSDESVACMPCAGLHAYHHGCVRQWLGHGNPQCPTCRWTVDAGTREALPVSIARAEARLARLAMSATL
jgi:hypothetical protein